MKNPDELGGESALPDITHQIRQTAAYLHAMGDEKNEKHEKPMQLDAGSSFNSCISSCVKLRPQLSDEALHGIAGEIVRLHSGITEADPAALMAQLLTGLGSLIGPGPYFMADGARHHCNLFTIICGRTAKARKGTSWARVKNVLSSLDDLWLTTSIKSGVVSGEGITQVFQDDNDRRLLLLESEFGQVLQAMRREGNTVSVLLRQAWDGTRLAVLRRNNPIEVEGAHISMIGHITLPELHQLLDRVEISNGTANRCLWVYADRATLLPDGGQVPELDSQLTRLARAVDAARDRGEVKRHPETRERWAEIYQELSREFPGKLGELLSRGEAQVMRLALLFALLDDEDSIRLQHLESALAFWRYCEASTAFIFQEHLLSKKAKKIFEALQTGPQTTTQLHRLFNNNATSAEIEAALGEFGGRITLLPLEAGGGKEVRLIG